jgi:acetolactate synthase-1/2/3 large subunit
LTVMHEESGTGMAHGYAKVAGKPMALLFHGTVGLQHATMGIYNAWCDRVPLILMVGNHKTCWLALSSSGHTSTSKILN